MFRDDELGLQFPLKGFPDPLIGSHSSLKDNRGKDLFAPADIVQIILNQGVTKSSDDVLNGMADLLFMNHVRFCEDCASSGNPDRVFSPLGQPSKLLNGKTEPSGLLV